MLCVRSLQVPSMDPLPNSAKLLGRIAAYIIMAVEFTPLFNLSRPAIKREPNMKLEGGEKLVLEILHDLQGDSTDYVDDARLALATKMLVEDVRLELETLEEKGFVERTLLTDGVSAYVTAKGKQALRLAEPIPSPKPRRVGLPVTPDAPGGTETASPQPATAEGIIPMADAPRVFISYSWDSVDHTGRVLELADALRGRGINVILDQYVHPTPEEGWPRWMDRSLDEAQFVVMVCTETYRRRVMGREEPGKGLGVRWEGSLIYNRIYNDKPSGSRFIPILLRPGSEPAHIPNPVQGHTYYRITTFDLTDPGYEALYRHLTDQPRTLPPEIGQLQTLPPLPQLQASGKLREQPQVDQPAREDSHTETTMQGKSEPDKPQHCPSGRSDPNNVLNLIVKNLRNGIVVPVLGPSINRNIYVNLADCLVKLVADEPPVSGEQQMKFIKTQYGSPCSVCHLLPELRPPECPLIKGLSSNPPCPIYQEHTLSVAKTNCRILSQLYKSNSSFRTLYFKLQDCIIESSRDNNAIHLVLARLLKYWRVIGSRVPKLPALRFPIIISTSFDAGLEKVFDQEGIPYDLVWRVAVEEDDCGQWRHLGYRAQERVILPKPGTDESKKYKEFPFGKGITSHPAPEPRVIIIKAFGSINDPTCERVSSTMQEGDDYFMITQAQMESFLRDEVEKLILVLVKVIRSMNLLFLGFSPNDPDLRAIVDHLYDRHNLQTKSWIIHECEPGTLDQKIWRDREVELLRVDSLEETMSALEREVCDGS